MSPVSTAQIRDMLLAIPSWARVLPSIADDTPFPDCGMDSLALLELVSELQRVYGVEIPDDDVEKIATIADTARYLNLHMS
jgi:acyl carrier protein